MSDQGEGEFGFIRTHLRPLAAGAPGALALTDDAALLDLPPGHHLVAASDMLVAGRHFLADGDPADAAWKALAANLSDLAAMGATPLGYLSSIAWPDKSSAAFRAGYVKGLAAAQTAFGVALLGGDTTATGGDWTLSITALGHVPAGQALLRSGARPGDDVWLSGAVGEAFLGLAMARGERPADPACLARYLRPTPRLALGEALRGIATACIDISDGLAADLGHLATQSGVAIALEADAIPTGAAAGRAPVADLASGGDDYELAFTAPCDRRDAIEAIGARLDLVLTRIGGVSGGEGVTLLDAQGAPVPLKSAGFTHF